MLDLSRESARRRGVSDLSRFRVWSFGPSRNDEDRSPPHGAAHAGGERIGQVLAEQLLDEIERIEKRAVLEDASVAQCKEFRDLEMHDAVVVALAQAEGLDGCDPGAIDGQEFDVVLAARIALLLGLDRFGDPVLAVLVAEMRE